MNSRRRVTAALLLLLLLVLGTWLVQQATPDAPAGGAGFSATERQWLSVRLR